LFTLRLEQCCFAKRNFLGKITTRMKPIPVTSSSSTGPTNLNTTSAVSYAYAKVHGMTNKWNNHIDVKKQKWKLVFVLIFIFIGFIFVSKRNTANNNSLTGAMNNHNDDDKSSTLGGADPDMFEKELDDNEEVDDEALGLIETKPLAETTKEASENEVEESTLESSSSDAVLSDSTTQSESITTEKQQATAQELLEKEEDKPIPKKCHSRRNDRPGNKNGGARVHFIHIPKSGGTSVVSWLRFGFLSYTSANEQNA
jgi:hypothetical protein